MLSSAELGVSQVMQLPVSHGRLLLIKLIAEMETFRDILPKYAVAHIHPITLVILPLKAHLCVELMPITLLLTVAVRFSMGCHLVKLYFTVWW